MKSEKRKRRGILAMIAADPYRKLAAIALAVGLWFFLNSQITRKWPVTMQLATIGTQESASAPFSHRVAIVLPTDQVVGKQFYNGDEKIDSIKVNFSGQRFRIDALEDEKLDLRITSFVGRDWGASPTSIIEFTADQVQRNLRSLQDVEISFEPPRIRLAVELKDTRQQRLTLDDIDLLQLEPSVEQRIRKDTAKFSPDYARIQGSVSNLTKFPAAGAKPFRATFTPVGSSAREISVVIELAAPPELGLTLAQKPTLTVQLTPDTKPYELELPVLVDDLALPPHLRGLYVPQNPTQIVRVRAGGALRQRFASMEAEPEKLREYAAQHLRLEVWIEPPLEGTTYGNELPREALLRLRGPLLKIVEPGDYSLADTYSIRLHRRP